MKIPFTKLQSNGNDFIIIDECKIVVIPDEMKGQFAAFYCKRRFGIGADGVIYISKSQKNNLKMRLFQPDKSEADMCGNGICCLAKYTYDTGYVKDTCTIETLSGEIVVTMGYKNEGFFAIVTMPKPKFGRKDIPATREGENKERVGNYEVYTVNTGVPHAVILVDSVDKVDIATDAPSIRYHATFPKGANVNFVERKDHNCIKIRTFERGVEAETLSCGTGATASAIIMHKLGYVGETVNVETKGGSLIIYLKDGVKMRSPSITVYSGVIS
jgi:diaminopimelate epimerase